jgi:hypothetical protein
MKYWNNEDDFLKWYKIKNSNLIGFNMKPDYIGFGSEIVVWCKKYPSDGQFFIRADNLSWYFEKEEDVVMFALRWS